MADLSTIVDPDGGGNYTSASTADNAEAQDLTDGGGDTFTIWMEASADSADTVALLVGGGWTTGATTYLRFRASAGEEALQSGVVATRARLEVTDASTVDCREDYVRFENLQLGCLHVGAGGATVFGASVGAPSDIRLTNCYLYSDGGVSSYQGIIWDDADATLTVTNCIMYNVADRCIDFNAGTMTVTNCVFRGNNFRAGIDQESGSTLTINNTAIFNTTNDVDSGGTITIDFCAADDDLNTEWSVSNCVQPSGADWDNEFTDPDNGDFTPLNGGNIFEAGTTASTATDIAGVTWNDPATIGAAEFVAAAGNPWYYYEQMKLASGM